jgi:glucosamine--fructose-6-phosphate aminotransferase (isomerizing)
LSAPDRVAAFRDDIAASPEALSRLLDGWRAPDLGRRRRFLFAGLGSSRYAALVVAGPVRAAGGTAWVEYAGGDAPGAPSDDLVAVCISASGRTPEVLDTAERYAGRGLVVAVTNQPDGPLAGRADIVVPLDAGAEASGIAGRTFRATIAALGLLSGATTVDELRVAVDGLATRLTDPPVDADVDVLDGAPSIDVLGPASVLGVAEQAALMLREAPRLPARAYETADWLHTGVYLALPGHRVVLLPGSSTDDEVVATVERRAGRIVRLPARDARHGPLAEAIVASLVPERLAAELWQRTRADDKEP